MNGLFINDHSDQLSVNAEDSYLTLLAQLPGIEIMKQTILSGSTIWVEPAEDRDTVEFFYLLSGSLELALDTGTVYIGPGGSFHVHGLEQEVYLRAASETKLIYITNRPMFEELFGYQGNLNQMMHLVDDKDNYTYNHCYRVMEYSIHLSRRMQLDSVTLDEMVTASLFHDIGKYYIPTEILNKPGRLTEREFQLMMRHPIDSARLLAPKFGKKVADIARSHHERLDGSGYPFGLSAGEITPESRIIAVVDSFDAMTSHRCYRPATMTFTEAAEELASLPRLYDRDVTGLLLDSVKSGKLKPEVGKNENIR